MRVTGGPRLFPHVGSIPGERGRSPRAGVHASCNDGYRAAWHGLPRHRGTWAWCDVAGAVTSAAASEGRGGGGGGGGGGGALLARHHAGVPCCSLRGRASPPGVLVSTWRVLPTLLSAAPRASPGVQQAGAAAVVSLFLSTILSGPSACPSVISSFVIRVSTRRATLIFLSQGSQVLGFGGS